MGWWQINSDGANFDVRATGLIWGDELADIMDEAIDKIRSAYKREWQREITAAELHAGFRFSAPDQP